MIVGTLHAVGRSPAFRAAPDNIGRYPEKCRGIAGQLIIRIVPVERRIRRMKSAARMAIWVLPDRVE